MVKWIRQSCDHLIGMEIVSAPCSWGWLPAFAAWQYGRLKAGKHPKFVVMRTGGFRAGSLSSLA